MRALVSRAVLFLCIALFSVTGSAGPAQAGDSSTSRADKTSSRAKFVGTLNKFKAAKKMCVTQVHHKICRGVDNKSGKEVMIPARSSAEWTSFISNPPPNVDLHNCVIDETEESMFVRAPDVDGSRGAVLAYRRGASNRSWRLYQKIVPSSRVAGMEFGERIKINGRTLSIKATGTHCFWHRSGAGRSSRSCGGSTYFFEKQGETWVQVGMIAGGTNKAISGEVPKKSGLPNVNDAGDVVSSHSERRNVSDYSFVSQKVNGRWQTQRIDGYKESGGVVSGSGDYLAFATKLGSGTASRREVHIFRRPRPGGAYKKVKTIPISGKSRDVHIEELEFDGELLSVVLKRDVKSYVDRYEDTTYNFANGSGHKVRSSSVVRNDKPHSSTKMKFVKRLRNQTKQVPGSFNFSSAELRFLTHYGGSYSRVYLPDLSGSSSGGGKTATSEEDGDGCTTVAGTSRQ